MEGLSINELQSIIYNLNFQLRTHNWNVNKSAAKICQAKIDRYTTQLNLIQDEQK
jgi:hypothetical protein